MLGVPSCAGSPILCWESHLALRRGSHLVPRVPSWTGGSILYRESHLVPRDPLVLRVLLCTVVSMGPSCTESHLVLGNPWAPSCTESHFCTESPILYFESNFVPRVPSCTGESMGQSCTESPILYRESNLVPGSPWARLVQSPILY